MGDRECEDPTIEILSDGQRQAELRDRSKSGGGRVADSRRGICPVIAGGRAGRRVRDHVGGAHSRRVIQCVHASRKNPHLICRLPWNGPGQKEKSISRRGLARRARNAGRPRLCIRLEGRPRPVFFRPPPWSRLYLVCAPARSWLRWNWLHAPRCRGFECRALMVRPWRVRLEGARRTDLSEFVRTLLVRKVSARESIRRVRVFY